MYLQRSVKQPFLYRMDRNQFHHFAVMEFSRPLAAMEETVRVGIPFLV